MGKYRILVTHNEELEPNIMEIWEFLNENKIVVEKTPDQDTIKYGVSNAFVLVYSEETKAREAFGALRGLQF